MSEPQSIAGFSASRVPPANGGVRAAIARAAQKTGVDFDYLLAQAKIESSLNPGAKAPTSSAAGLYQFTNGTWLRTLEKHGGDHGMGWADAMIDGGRVTDPSARSQIMAMRYDADTSALMAAELANDNKAELTATLGREPDAAELYMAHFLGSAGAQQFLSALQTNPGQSAAAILPKAAAANRGIFFDGGVPRSVAGVMELMRAKVSNAMEDGGLPPMDYDTGLGMTQLANFQPQGQPEVTGGPIARQFAAARQEMSDLPTARRSMAETLQNAFASTSVGGASSVPANVRAAYGQLQKFGM
ncbi:lytic transglycosylase domain-containing protein [Novosphingobium sp. JCM 18896]|uniref:lytic transglycosylase domain-containing protein n=1 Tax=Novosphingobium sp. JCM 18896 TaxID=2989731 RepID=UPI00222243A8|nr:lytic transglycosylase domain-containing protein [Novosphingobium sp. JCM 18896]MCW1428823.1 lytic transglycosylase domain-containing protein [Novosphingobium sp. JCM 18896]